MPTHLRVFSRTWSVAGVALGVALLPQVCMAALGGTETALAIETQHLGASATAEDRSGYRVHDITLASGTRLREFATVGGTIFAVAWRGPAMPDLRQALGQYFGAYVDAASVAHQGHAHLEIHHDGLVMQSSGHMRMFMGRAYLSRALPADASLDEIH